MLDIGMPLGVNMPVAAVAHADLQVFGQLPGIQAHEKMASCLVVGAVALQPAVLRNAFDPETPAGTGEKMRPVLQTIAPVASMNSINEYGMAPVPVALGIGHPIVAPPIAI